MTSGNTTTEPPQTPETISGNTTARRGSAGRRRVHTLRRDEVDGLVAGYRSRISVKDVGSGSD